MPRRPLTFLVSVSPGADEEETAACWMIVLLTTYLNCGWVGDVPEVGF